MRTKFDSEGRVEVVSLIGRIIRTAEVGTNNGYSLLVLTLDDGSVLEIEEQSQTGYFVTEHKMLCDTFNHSPY